MIANPRWFLGAVYLSVAAVLSMGGAARLGADEGDVFVTKVCESWEVTVGQPNTVRNAPQVTMIMSPHPDLENDYFSFLLNFRCEPDYSPGGMQLLHLKGTEVVDHRDGPCDEMLHHDSETVSWRQSLSIENGALQFDVDEGDSESWGSFGGQGYLRQSVATSLTNLNGYRPRVSLTESGIGFAGNRVESLRLMRLEWHLSDDRVVTFTAPIDIDSDLDPWD